MIINSKTMPSVKITAASVCKTKENHTPGMAFHDAFRAIIFILALCLFPGIAGAQLKTIPIKINVAAAKALEGAAVKAICTGSTCPAGKTCHDGCCIYPLGSPAQGNWNYIINSNCNAMKDLKLSFKVTKDIEAEYDIAANCAQIPAAGAQKINNTQGVVVQFNCFSKDADKTANTGGMVQYIFYISGQTVYPHIQYVSGTPDGLDHDWLWQGGNTFPGLQLPKANTLSAGYTVQVELGTDNNGYVNNVTFTVIDNHGKSYVLTAPKSGTPVPQATAARPGTLYPLRVAEFQTNVVSTNGLYVHFKSGGEGTLTYSSKDVLCVEGGAYEHCVNAGTGTCESSNAIYGALSSCCTQAGQSFSQSVKIDN